MDVTTEASSAGGGDMEWQGRLGPTPAATDRERFEDVPREHGEALLRWALQLTGDQSSAADLVQDTYERALRRGLDAVPPERMRSWLFVIAKNQFLDAYRSRRRHRAVAIEQVMLSIEAPNDLLDDAARGPWATLGLDDLRRAVDRLSPTLAHVYRMHAFEKLDYAAISARLNIPMTTVGTRLLRARLKLRDMLSDEGAGCAPLAPRRTAARAMVAPVAVRQAA
jgi:RNA polymerase sigma-70 factor (ECF subfamily)